MKKRSKPVKNNTFAAERVQGPPTIQSDVERPASIPRNYRINMVSLCR